MLDSQKTDSSVTMAVLIVLVLLMVVWGWFRAHAQPDLNPVNAPPASKGGGMIPTS